MAWLSDGVEVGDLGKVVEDRVQRGVAEVADVGDVKAGGGHGISHDRAIAAELFELGDQFDVGRTPGRIDDALAEGVEGVDGVVVVGVVALINHGDNRIDKAIEPDEHGRVLDRFGKGAESGGGGLCGFSSAGHRHLEVGWGFVR